MPFGKYGGLEQSAREESNERSKVYWQSHYDLQSKEISRVAGTDGMQTAIRQCRQTEIILARPRQGDSRSSKRELLPHQRTHTQKTSSPLQQAVRVSGTHLETPCKTCKNQLHVQQNHKSRAQLQGSSRISITRASSEEQQG